MDSLRQALRVLLRPGEGFREVAGEAPTLGPSFRRMLAWWLPAAYVHAGLTAWSFLRAYQSLREGWLPSWAGVVRPAGLDPEGLRDLLKQLPAPPTFAHLGLWLLLLVPVGVLGAWLHHAVWDHTCLWILGGLKERRGFRTSLVAEAQALRIAALGTVAGLLGFLPGVGIVLALPLALLDAYLWVFRGFSMAAFHGCPTWKGVAATVLHAALVGLFALGFLAALVVLAGLRL